MRTSNVKNLEELFIYAINNPYVGNGLITTLVETVLRVDYDNKAGGPFQVGETVTAAGFSGIVSQDSSALATGVGYLELDNTSGALADDDVLTGGTSGATADTDGVPAINIGENTRNAGDVFTPADAEVVVRCRRASMGVGADTVLTLAQEITYTGKAAGPYTIGETVTESVSGATGVVVADSNVGATGVGVLTLSGIVGVFTGGQTLTGGGSGATSTGGVYTDRQATFVDGSSIDEAVRVTIGGIALSPVLVTGGASKNSYEVLRGFPAFTSDDYISFVNAKTNEPGILTVDVRDKMKLVDRKDRGDVERRLSMTADYENGAVGLSNLSGKDILIIAEREDNGDGVETEISVFMEVNVDAELVQDETTGDAFSTVTTNPRFERSYNLPG